MKALSPRLVSVPGSWLGEKSHHKGQSRESPLAWGCRVAALAVAWACPLWVSGLSRGPNIMLDITYSTPRTGLSGFSTPASA